MIIKYNNLIKGPVNINQLSYSLKAIEVNKRKTIFIMIEKNNYFKKKKWHLTQKRINLRNRLFKIKV